MIIINNNSFAAHRCNINIDFFFLRFYYSRTYEKRKKKK